MLYFRDFATTEKSYFTRRPQTQNQRLWFERDLTAQPRSSEDLASRTRSQKDFPARTRSQEDLTAKARLHKNMTSQVRSQEGPTAEARSKEHLTVWTIDIIPSRLTKLLFLTARSGSRKGKGEGGERGRRIRGHDPKRRENHTNKEEKNVEPVS